MFVDWAVRWLTSQMGWTYEVRMPRQWPASLCLRLLSLGSWPTEIRMVKIPKFRCSIDKYFRPHFFRIWIALNPSLVTKLNQPAMGWSDQLLEIRALQRASRPMDRQPSLSPVRCNGTSPAWGSSLLLIASSTLGSHGFYKWTTLKLTTVELHDLLFIRILRWIPAEH